MNQPLPPVPSPAAAWLEQQYFQNDIELSGRILMSAIIAFFFLLCLFIIFHVFRLFLHRAFSGSPLFDERSYHHRHHRRRRHPNFVFVFSGPDPPDHSTGRMPKGLDPAVLRSLPFFVFSSLVHEKGLECSVCLCEFEEEERGRALGGCGHCFHIDCIDLWFQSHSTCPLCRAEVKSPPSPSATGETPQLGPIPLGAAVECTASEEELSVAVHHVPQAAETENPESAKPLPPTPTPTPPPPPPPETRFVGLINFLSRERWVGSSNDFSSNDIDLEAGDREPQGQEVKR